MNESLRGRALRLLASREHSRLELKRKLASHAESGEALEALLDELEKARLLANDRYAEQRVTVRGGRYGNARQQIDIFLAVHVPESRALASHDSQRVTAVGTAEQALFPGFHGGKSL